MSKLKVNHYVVGPVQTNCYFAINEETKELLVIDPGASAKQLAERIRQEGCKPVAILLTHGHFDHATGAEELAQEFDGIPIYVYEDDKETLADPEMNVSYMMGRELVFHADKFLRMSRRSTWRDFISGCSIRLDIHRGAAATIFHMRMWCLPEIPCFADQSAARISREEVLRSLCVQSRIS